MKPYMKYAGDDLDWRGAHRADAPLPPAPKGAADVNMRERIHAAFSDGAVLLDRQMLAYRLWPPSEHPGAWRYASHCGPPAWVRTLGAAMKRYDLRETYNSRTCRWEIRKPTLKTDTPSRPHPMKETTT